MNLWSFIDIFCDPKMKFVQHMLAAMFSLSNCPKTPLKFRYFKAEMFLKYNDV